MPFGNAKVYFDGSHYIAIPHSTRDTKYRPKRPEETITVIEEPQSLEQSTSSTSEDVSALPPENIIHSEENLVSNEPQEQLVSIKPQRKTTRTELFNTLYDENSNLPRFARKKIIVQAMRPYFKSDESTENFVNINLDRKQRNLICRRIRCVRKAYLQQFNYFVTFTYDDKLHTEESFRKKLKKCLSNFCTRKDWKYIGVWERSPEKKRLHFHGMFYVPDNTMPGFLFSKNDYNFNTHKRQITVQNAYFNEHFGRSDFETIDHKNRLVDAIAYILKYIEKSNDKIVYSKGMHQFFMSDIMDEDIVCTIGMEDKKLLLFDDFNCFDEGELIGKVSPQTIKQLRGCN